MRYAQTIDSPQPPRTPVTGDSKHKLAFLSPINTDNHTLAPIAMEIFPSMVLPGCYSTVAQAKRSALPSCTHSTTTTRKCCFKIWLIPQQNSSHCSGQLSANTLVRQHRFDSEGKWLLHMTAQPGAKPSTQLWSAFTVPSLVHCWDTK